MPSRSNQGFALLITITLVAFLVLVLVGLATFTRVETQVAGNSQTQAKARQNALLGLQVAIGQLQKFAGPDQRVTAPADLLANTDRSGSPVNQVGSAAAVPGKQSVSTGARHWTGVWGNAADPAANSGQRRFLNWLVSGNESVPVSATETGPAFGRILSPEPAGATLPVKATDATNLSLSTRPTDNITLGARDARLLVGPRSAGTETADLANYVVAPLVDINAANAQIPGLGAATGNAPIGRYAYWIGDEGVKARINLANPWPQATNLADAASERTWGFATAQRTAGERMQGLANLATDPAIVAKLLTPKQVNFASASTLSADELGRRYHDYSLVSRGVLADPRRGGLKRDLTRILAPGGGSADEADTAPLFPHLGNPADPFYARPATWGLLRDFASFGSAPFGTLQSRTPSATRTGISPVLLLARLDYTHTVSPPSGTPATQTWNAHISPYFILWNPYNRPLQGARYEIGVQGPRKTLGAEQRGLVEYTLTLPPLVAGDPPPPDQTMWLNLGSARFEHPDYPRDGIDPALWSAPTTRRDFLRFTAVVPTLQPGQSVFIGLPNGTPDYTPGMPLVARSYLDRQNYSNVARARTDSLAINPATVAAISLPDTKRFGEVNAYLGVEGTGADPAAATNSGSSNYHQWIGRVEISSPLSFADSFGPTNQTISTGSTGNPLAVASFQIWHQLGVANDLLTAPLQSRWVAAANPRAYMVNRTGLEYGGDDDLVVNPVYHGLIGAISLSGGNIRLPIREGVGAPGGVTEAAIGNDYANSSFAPNHWPRPILFEVPERDQPLFSIADLRHAAVSAHATSPAYPVGNSLADFRVASAGLPEVALSVGSGYLDPVGGAPFGPPSQVLYDHSYLLNQALWDRYFFSTIPDAPALPAPLPNSRHTFASRSGTPPALADLLADTTGRETASHLLLDGGFNINSTSIDAWRAFLGGTFNLPYNPLNPSDANPSATESPADTAAFSRFRRPRNSWQELAPASGANMVNYYGGYRRLSPAELDGLAQRIVAEVRERGPFLSLAEFVNRSLSGPSDRTRLKGPLQAALDDEANPVPSTRINFVAEQTTTTNGGGRHTTTRSGGNAKNPDAYAPFEDVVAPYHRAAYVGYNTNSLNTPAGSYTRNDAYFPGYLTQADLLSTLGATATARSDTFVVRAYGETLNPVTRQIEGRAWCEAVVQRLPEYVNPAQDEPFTEVGSLTDPSNRRLGRRFEIVSFRWLTAEDI